jgi:hypothetical protein
MTTTIEYGYRESANGALEEHPEEQAIIGHVRSLRASGMTFRAIVAALQAEGVATTEGRVDDGGAR